MSTACWALSQNSGLIFNAAPSRIAISAVTDVLPLTMRTPPYPTEIRSLPTPSPSSVTRTINAREASGSDPAWGRQGQCRLSLATRHVLADRGRSMPEEFTP